MQTECSKLPDSCGTVACANEFVPFFSDCSSILQQDKQKYQGFLASCQELRAGSKRMLLQPMTVQMFRVAIATMLL